MSSVREYSPGSEDYQLSYQLRDMVLRQPLGLSLSDEDLSQEKHQHHFGLFEEKALIACAVVKPLSPQRAKIRQVAVSPKRQGQGCGLALMQALEEILSREGILELELHSRETSLGFYQRLGYQAKGQRFLEVGLPHILMEKTLSATLPPASQEAKDNPTSDSERE